MNAIILSDLSICCTPEIPKVYVLRNCIYVFWYLAKIVNCVWGMTMDAHFLILWCPYTSAMWSVWPSMYYNYKWQIIWSADYCCNAYNCRLVSNHYCFSLMVTNKGKEILLLVKLARWACITVTRDSYLGCVVFQVLQDYWHLWTLKMHCIGSQ